jgi:hypothetical protein
MPRRLAVLLLVLLGLAVAPYPSSPASADCAAPQLSIDGEYSSRGDPIELQRGDEVTIEGRYFVDGCNDTGGGGAFGCSQDEPESTPPQQNVELQLLEKRSSATGISLGRADADGDGRATWTITVPSDAPTGSGVMRAGTSSELYVTVS